MVAVAFNDTAITERYAKQYMDFPENNRFYGYNNGCNMNALNEKISWKQKVKSSFQNIFRSISNII